MLKLTIETQYPSLRSWQQHLSLVSPKHRPSHGTKFNQALTLRDPLQSVRYWRLRFWLVAGFNFFILMSLIGRLNNSRAMQVGLISLQIRGKS